MTSALISPGFTKVTSRGLRKLSWVRLFEGLKRGCLAGDLAQLSASDEVTTLADGWALGGIGTEAVLIGSDDLSGCANIQPVDASTSKANSALCGTIAASTFPLVASQGMEIGTAGSLQFCASAVCLREETEGWDLSDSEGTWTDNEGERAN